MSIYGLNIDITKDRLYKVGREKRTLEMARNTIAGLTKKGYLKEEIVDFLSQELNLSQEEINQAFEGLEEQQ
jgi:DNA-directed RNA polymerase specialized sigma54-like protein